MRISDWSSDVCSSDLHGGLTPLDRSSNPRTSAMSRLLSRLSISLIAVVAACGTTVPAHAQSWAESWFDHVTYTSPGSFEDQTRGYLTAGGMSGRSEEHTSELQSLMRISYAVFCLKTKTQHKYTHQVRL